MTIRLEIIADDSTEFAQKLLGVVGALSFAGQRASAAQTVVAPDSETSTSTDKPATEAVARRSRKPKEEPAPVVEPERTGEPDPEVEQIPAGEEKQPTVAPAEKPATIVDAVSEDLRLECQAALRKVLATKGNAVAAEILKKFGARNISTIPAGRHAEFKADCEQALGE